MYWLTSSIYSFLHLLFFSVALFDYLKLINVKTVPHISRSSMTIVTIIVMVIVTIIIAMIIVTIIVMIILMVVKITM